MSAPRYYSDASGDEPGMRVAMSSPSRGGGMFVSSAMTPEASAVPAMRQVAEEVIRRQSPAGSAVYWMAELAEGFGDGGEYRYVAWSPGEPLPAETGMVLCVAEYPDEVDPSA